MDANGVDAIKRALASLASLNFDETFTGSQFVLAAFEALLLAAIRNNMFKHRTSFFKDLEVASSDDQTCRKNKMAYDLFTKHLFQLDRVRPILKRLVQCYVEDSVSFDEVICDVRVQACTDLVQFVCAVCTVTNTVTRDSDKVALEAARIACTKKAIVHFGASLAQSEDLAIDLCPFLKALDACRYQFRNSMGYGGDISRSDDMSHSTKVESSMTPLPLYQSQLERMVTMLASAPDGVLPRLKKRLQRLTFSLSDTRELQQIQTVSVELAEARVPWYFPVADSAAPAPGFRLGGNKKVLGGSIASVAYAWGDFSIAIIYVVKLVRFLTQLAALWIAVKVFKDAYVRDVYSSKKDPPSLKNLLFLFLGIDLTIQLLVVALIVMLAPNANDEFMSQLLLDELATTAMIAILGSIIASFVWRKTYFHYKNDGLGAIKSYGDIMVGVCAVMVVVPYFMLV